jgi:heme-degrading monooxygenase HmoA
MITRIVKMTFAPDKVSEFQALFNESKERIAGFPGCSHLKLLNSVENPAIFFTYSIWDSEESLNKYRDSELFASVWGRTKGMFAAKPEAWSTQVKFES